MNNKIYSELFNDMNFMLFIVNSDNDFHAVSLIPQWFELLYLEKIADSSMTDQLNMNEAFPFIQHFMEQADEIRLQSNKNIIESGIWTEENNLGEEYQFCAYHYINHKKVYLIIENRTPLFSQQHQVLQKARDIALVNEQLLQEVTLNQRLLQTDIEAQLNKSPEYLSELLNKSKSAIMVCSNDGEIEILNQALIDIYHLDDNNTFTKSSLLDKWVSEAKDQYPEIQTALKNGANWEGEFETQDLLGQSKWIRLTIKGVYSNNHPLSHYICIANDIDNFKKSHENLLDRRITDFITKLPNRNSFWSNFDNIIKQSEAHDQKVGLLCIDLDYFKQINNDFGYSSGDFLLKIISSRIVDHVKKGDFVAHLGGDEFAVILKNIKSFEDINLVANRLKNNINLPVALADKPIRITCSMGSVLFPLHGTNEKQLMKHADLAMYYAKELGRNQHQFYNDRLEQIKFKMERDKELHDAIRQNQFFLNYQPQVNLNKMNNFRFEALIRWQHPETGIVSPNEFIDSAERSGLIVPIGRWVLHQACSKAKEFINKNIPAIVAVNVSPKQLKHPDFYDMVKNTLSNLQLPAHCLEIEITENSFLEGIDKIAPVLQKVRQLGVSISLDDFGSGFSSFNYLRKLPLDVLKIDRTFIMELETSEDSRVIATMIIKLAKALKLKVIAEGVETKMQLEFLIEQQCDIVQGYYFYRPLGEELLLQAYQDLTSKNKKYLQ